MAFKQEDVEKFEHDWHIVDRHLGYMLENKIVSNGMYQAMKSRIYSLQSLMVDISDAARGDKD